jgi:DNA processing protein
VVVEAGWRSGSLNTAGHAAQIGRPIGAVPGPVSSAASAGCHRLIRDYDATLVTNADEVAQLLTAPGESATGSVGQASRVQGVARPPSAEETRLLDALSFSAPREVADVAARAGLSVAAVQSLLGAFEIDERVTEKERGWVKLKPRDPSARRPS